MILRSSFGAWIAMMLSGMLETYIPPPPDDTKIFEGYIRCNAENGYPFPDPACISDLQGGWWIGVVDRSVTSAECERISYDCYTNFYQVGPPGVRCLCLRPAPQ
jgi:hypothetical protein